MKHVRWVALAVAKRVCFAMAALMTMSAVTIAVDIPSGSSVGPVPDVPGNGLNGQYWKLAPKTIGEDPNALKLNGYPIIASQPPTATFTSTSVNYTGDDLTPITTWLGADAVSINPQPLPPGRDMDDGLIRLSGYYAQPAAGSVNFRMSSDDGSILKIGGVTVIDNDGSHGSPGPAPNGSATFASAGLYPVEVTYYNGDWTDPANPAAHGGANIAWRLGSEDAAPIVPTASLYTVPEPASLALLGLGSLAALLWRSRRGK